MEADPLGPGYTASQRPEVSGTSGELSAYGKCMGFAGKECREGFLAEPQDTTFGNWLGRRMQNSRWKRGGRNGSTKGSTFQGRGLPLGVPAEPPCEDKEKSPEQKTNLAG